MKYFILIALASLFAVQSCRPVKAINKAIATKDTVVSIPSKIAEGYGRHSEKELIHFLFITLGSASEFETQLLISYRLGLLTDVDYFGLNRSISEIIRMLSALIKTKNNGSFIHSENLDSDIKKNNQSNRE